MKVIHRLVSNEDVEALSGPNYLQNYHRRRIATLATGTAVVYGEGMQQPYNLAIDPYEAPYPMTPYPNSISESDRIVSDAMKIFCTQEREFSAPESYASKFHDVGALVANDPGFRVAFNRLVLSTLKDPMQLIHSRQQIVDEIERVIGGLGAQSPHFLYVAWSALVQATERYFERKGEQNWWFYDQVSEQKQRWLALLRPAFHPEETNRKLDKSVWRKWQDDLIYLHKRDHGPYPTCSPCTSKCVYRFEAAETVRDSGIKIDFNSALNRKDISSAVRADSTASFCQNLAMRMVGQVDIDFSYCLAVHLIRNQKLSTKAQLMLLEETRKSLENSNERDK